MMMRPSGVLLLITIALPAWGQRLELRPHSPDGLSTVPTFFSIDSSVPLDVHVVERTRALGFPREKLVFTGARGARVPAYLSYPDSGPPHPLVFLIHAGGSSKDAWWQTDSYERGAELTRKLLQAGYAVCALDARNHGERTSGVDFVPIPTLYFTNKWWATFRAMVVETTADHLRALQYLSSRRELDVRRVATIGQSMGGFTGFYLAGLDSRITTVVAGAPALAEPWLYPLTALNFAPAVRGRAVLILAGERDQLIPRQNTDSLMALLGPSAEFRLLPSDHRLPPEYLDIAFKYLEQHLHR